MTVHEFGYVNPRRRKILGLLTVKEIRRLYTAGECTQMELARRFGVSRTAIYDVLNQRTWGWVK